MKTYRITWEGSNPTSTGIKSMIVHAFSEKQAIRKMKRKTKVYLFCKILTIKILTN
jgi:hypothetical protein